MHAESEKKRRHRAQNKKLIALPAPDWEPCREIPGIPGRVLGPAGWIRSSRCRSWNQRRDGISFLDSDEYKWNKFIGVRDKLSRHSVRVRVSHRWHGSPTLDKISHVKRRVAAISPLPSHARRVKRAIRRVDTFARRLCSLEDTSLIDSIVSLWPSSRIIQQFPIPRFLLFSFSFFFFEHWYNNPSIANRFHIQVLGIWSYFVAKFNFGHF